MSGQAEFRAIYVADLQSAVGFHEHRNQDIPDWLDRSDSPSMSDIGDQSIEPLWSATGRALMSWDFVEIALGQLFHAACQSRSIAPLVAFSAVDGAQTRFKLVKAAVLQDRQKASDSDRAEFMKLIRACERLSALRNHCAHASIMHFVTAHGAFRIYLEDGQTPNLFTVSVSPAIDPKTPDGKAKRWYCSREINQFSAAMDIIRDKIIAFASRVYFPSFPDELPVTRDLTKPWKLR